MCTLHFDSINFLNVKWLLLLVTVTALADKIGVDKEKVLVAEMPKQFQVAGRYRESNSKDSGIITRTSFGNAKYEMSLGLDKDWTSVGNRLMYNGKLQLNSSNSDDSMGIWFEQIKKIGSETLHIFTGQISYAGQLVNLDLSLSMNAPFLYFGDFRRAQFEYFSLSGLNKNEIVWSIETIIQKGQNNDPRRTIQAAEKVRKHFFALQEDAIAGEIMRAMDSFVLSQE